MKPTNNRSGTGKWKKDIKPEVDVFLRNPQPGDVIIVSAWAQQGSGRALSFSYDNKTKIAGLIYLHNITQKKMSGSTRLNYEVFHRICGEAAMERVVMTTTHWDSILPTSGEDRERELEVFWKDILSEGAQLMRIQDPYSDSHRIVDHILRLHAGRVAIQIQEELVDMDKRIPRTEAGKLLRLTMQEFLETQNKDADETDPEIQERVAVVQEQLKQMNIPILDRIKDRLFRKRRPVRDAPNSGRSHD
ncbi:hypothetical protein MD484_g5110, partial [Candolleomyces efflorescens]